MTTYWNNGYELVEDIISQDTADLLYNSFDLHKKALEYGDRMQGVDPDHTDELVQSHCFSTYGHVTFEALMQQLAPRVSEIVGHECVPAHSFARMYYPGASMKMHKDRPSCEVSMTLTVRAQGEVWPIWMRDLVGIAHPLSIPERSAVLYQGCVLDHWRDEYTQGQEQLQLFMHWVNPQGPNKDYVYDGRPVLAVSPALQRKRL